VRGAGSRPRLRLYVAGDAPNSLLAHANLRRLLRDMVEGPCELEIVDVFVDPQRAARDRILVTPTVVRVEKAMSRRVVGNLSDAELVLRTLGLHESERRGKT
jgi:circadian clock protein KaiB